ncbi:MAG: hypothetical protein KIT43_10690 [Bauldia sp.]|nr:hypothetical protein [Bauldia sp.]
MLGYAGHVCSSALAIVPMAGTWFIDDAVVNIRKPDDGRRNGHAQRGRRDEGRFGLGKSGAAGQD